MLEVGIVFFIALIGISYYFIFKEHHKRNKMTFSEIYPLVIEYAVVCIISCMLLFVGINAVINGYSNHDEIKEVIKELTIGLTIISLVILHYIFWVKKHRQDLNTEVRKEVEEKTSHIADWIEIITFVLLILASIFNIIKYMLFFDKVEKYRQISISVLCIIAAVILLRNLNPLNINERIKKLFKK